MSDYIRPERQLQVVISGELYVDTATGEAVEALQDSKFSWREKKRDALRLADVYREGSFDDKADKVHWCGTWLQYLATGDLSQRQLYHANLCHLRLCPVCAARRASQMAQRLRRILERVKEDHADTQLIFLTLTVQNCTGDKLRETLDLLTKAWKKLIDRRPVKRAVKGWFRALEITRNRSSDTYHPHIHAILVVENSYFKRGAGSVYLTQADWVKMWQACLQVQYTPVVGIQRTRPKKDGRPGGAAAAAAVEAAKYATKGSEYLSPALPIEEAAKVAGVYTKALYKKRLTAMGGWVKEAANALKVDVEDEGDLIHSDDGNGELTPKTAELLETWGWHYGVSDHVLRYRIDNPEYEPVAGQG